MSPANLEREGGYSVTCVAHHQRHDGKQARPHVPCVGEAKGRGEPTEVDQVQTDRYDESFYFEAGAYA